MWQILNKKEEFNCKITSINSMECYLPSKNISNKFISMDMHDWANVFTIDSDNNVIMVKQHRMGKNIVTIEVPAGTLNPGEDPETAAKRELEEETGYTAEKMILLKAIFVNPAIQTNKCYFFLATGCKKTKELQLDDTEEIEVITFPLKEILDARNTDLIENSITLLSIMLTKDYLTEKGLLK